MRSLRGAGRGAALEAARTCYDHLAGRLGVGLTDALVANGALVRGDSAFTLTATGERLLDGLGVDVAAARAQRRSFARSCLDWSERRPHLAGSLGAAVATTLLDRRWLVRRPADRGLTVTAEGRAGLAALGVSAD